MISSRTRFRAILFHYYLPRRMLMQRIMNPVEETGRIAEVETNMVTTATIIAPRFSARKGRDGSAARCGDGYNGPSG